MLDASTKHKDKHQRVMEVKQRAGKWLADISGHLREPETFADVQKIVHRVAKHGTSEEFAACFTNGVCWLWATLEQGVEDHE